MFIFPLAADDMRSQPSSPEIEDVTLDQDEQQINPENVNTDLLNP